MLAEDSVVETEKNQVDKEKSLKRKKREDVQIKKLIAVPCESIKTVVEEHLSSENTTLCWSMM